MKRRQTCEDLVATLADFAYAAIERGDPTVTLSTSGRFSDDFVQELMRVLPIDPYVAPEVLARLHAELLDLAQTASMEASWGRLADKDGDLEIVLPRSIKHAAELVLLDRQEASVISGRFAR